MNNIVIVKKCSINNQEYLDFALNDDNQLMKFKNFKAASDFLKKEVGTGEQLRDFQITTIDAHKDNVNLQKLLANSIDYSDVPNEPVVVKPTDEKPVVEKSNDENNKIQFNEFNLTDVDTVECSFLLDCSQYKIENHETFIDLTSGKKLLPAIVFLDAEKPEYPLNIPNFKLKASFVKKISLVD